VVNPDQIKLEEDGSEKQKQEAIKYRKRGTGLRFLDLEPPEPFPVKRVQLSQQRPYADTPLGDHPEDIRLAAES